MLRIIKVFRILKIEKTIAKFSDSKNKYARLIILIIIHTYIHHFVACMMYALALFEYEGSTGNSMVYYSK